MTAGIYTVSFTSNLGSLGGGLALFEGGRIHGGDESFLYLGHYRTEGCRVTAELTVSHYQGPAMSIFGPLSEFAVSFDGEWTATEFRAQGRLTGQPAVTLQVQGRKVADPVA